MRAMRRFATLALPTLALLLAGTGALFPFFSPFLGWLGVFLTGSDTSSNALFCSLQATTAHQVGVSDTLLVAANTTGGAKPASYASFQREAHKHQHATAIF